MTRTRTLPDPMLLILATLATTMGMFFIFDAGYARSLGQDRGMLPSEFKSQLMFVLPAIACGAFCSRLRPEMWLKLSKVLWFVALIMLIAVMKFGVEMNGARRWLGVGSFSIQPAEFAKLAAVLYLAGVFAERRPWPENIKPRRDWAHWMDTIVVPRLMRALPALLILVAAGLIDKEPDLGTAAVIAATAFAMFIPGGVSKKSLAVALVVAVGGCWFLIKQEPYRLERIENHVQRWRADNVDDTSYQTVQSELAMATGGFAGVGIGNGRAKQVIPAPTSDFIMATVAEEFGLLGSSLVLLVMGAIVWRLLYLSSKAPSRFGSLTLFGIAAWIGIQSCVNITMANGFLPAIGIPLPFISSGGSSLLTLWCGIGVAQAVCSTPIAVAVKERVKKAAPTHGRAVVSPRHSRMGART